MAEGTTQHMSFKDSISKASGDADEIFCEPCINRGQSIAVEGYCQICQEYMCGNCLDVHKNQKMSRNHSILDKNKMPTRQGTDTSQGMCTEVCERHHPEIIRFFCKAHGVPGCGDCMTLDHATCKKERVQDISEGFQTTEEFKQVHHKLYKLQKELKAIKDTLENNLKKLNTTFDTIQKKIKRFRKEINDYLDEMQKQLTEEADNLKKEWEKEMSKMIAENKSMKSEVEGIIQRIKNDPNDANTLFVLTKQANQRLNRIEKEINEIKQTEQEKHYVFRSSSKVESLLAAKEPIGKLFRKPNINTTVSYRGNISVTSTEDMKECWINECALLTHSHKIVITDGNNQKIKLIDINKKSVVSSYSTSGTPVGLQSVREDQIAVTSPAMETIELFHVGSKLTKLSQIRINCSDKDCFGFAHKDRKYAVTYIKPGRIEVIDENGRILHRIQPKQGNADFLQKCFNVAFGRDNGTVIVSDFGTNKVSVVSFEGQVLQTYTHTALKSPCGIELTADGILYVCSKENGYIHAVSSDFKTSKIIINNGYPVAKPVSIAYCDVNERLYVVNNIDGGDTRNNSLQVYGFDF